MTSVLPTWCEFCKHRKNPTECRAFDDIPRRFRAMGVKHDKVIDGQHDGFVWALDERYQAEFDDVQPYLQ